MDELLVFLQTYGPWLALIAIVGIVILGVLKYCNVFKKFDEKIRHVLYLVISVGISIIGSVIYLACIHQLDVTYIFTVSAAILALNQTFYTIYSNLSLKELFLKLIDWVKGLISKKEDTKTEPTEEENKGTDEGEGK